MTLTLDEHADAPARAILESFDELFLQRAQARLEHEATTWSKCGHVDPTNPRLLLWIGKDIAMTLFQILEGPSGRAKELRDRLREALAIMAPYDDVAPEVRELARAVRRREVYNVVRRAAVLLEQLDEPDAAALLHEYALRHEPTDGAQFSRIRRRKNELGAT